MPAPATVDEFLELIQKSGVVDPAKFETYLTRQKEAGPLPTEPTRCAGKLVSDAVLTRFQAEQLLQGKWKRFTIGKYKVLEKLGVGGMGQVFLCEHKLMRRRVAVKVLPASKGVDDASRERFYLEARAVAALDHPNIVRAYDIDQDEGLHFLVMEFVDGVNLQDLVKRTGPLDPHRACHYIYGSAIGLQYASDMGIIHRDIKPGNILIDRTGVVKILDMGLARFFHDEEDDSLTKKYDENVLGTADYLAPEQAVDSHSVTIRADLYSLGGTFYYLLTGLPPFPEGSVAQKLLWHQTRDPKAIGLIRPEVPAEVVAVVEKLMKKDPAERYQTPTELMAALQEYVQVPIPPPSDKELPQLSPAAMGNTNSTNRATGNTLIAGGNPLGPSSTSEFRSPFAKTPGGSSRDKLIPATAAPAPTNGVTADVQVGVWDSLDTDTAPRKGPETKKTPKVENAKKLQPAEAPPKSRKKLLWAGIAVGILALGGIAYGVAMLFKAPPAVVPAAVVDFSKIYITQGKGPENAATYKSVNEAITAIVKRPEFDLGARKYSPVIVLLDELHQENPSYIPRSERLKDLVIESSDPAKPVVWKAQANANGARLFELNNCLPVTIRNIVFDADNKLPHGLLLRGNLTGVRFEDVTVRNAKRSGVRFEAVVGEVAKPCVLNRVRVQLGAEADSGLQFAVPPNVTTPAPNIGIAVTNCRIEGPGNVGILIDSPLRDVEISRNRIYNLTNGLAIRQPFNPDALLKATITNNTFYEIAENGLAASEFDLPAGAEVNFSRNYFAKVKEIVDVKNLAALPNFKTPDNARDKTSGDAKLVVKAAVVENFALPSPKADEDGAFLRYPKSAPLAKAGPNGTPVGFPPD